MKAKVFDREENRAGRLLRRFTAVIITAVLSAAVLCACTDTGRPGNTNIIYKTIECGGLTRSYRLIFLSDLHLIAAGDPLVAPESKEIVDSRSSMFTKDGQTSEEYWQQLSKELDALKPDAVILGGDILDFCTPDAVSSLKAGLANISAPVLYVRADHDCAAWYSEGLETEEDIQKLQDGLIDNSQIITMDLGELKLIGINNSTSQLTNEARDRMMLELGVGSPEKEAAVIITHVPFEPESDEGLAAASEAAWNGRRLYWGPGGEYVPDDNTRDVLDFIRDNDSPVKAVLCGHLHFEYEGPLASNRSGTIQYIAAPAYEHNITVITVGGTDK